MVDVDRACDYVVFSSRRRHTRFDCDWSSDVCSSDLGPRHEPERVFEQDQVVGDEGRVDAGGGFVGVHPEQVAVVPPERADVEPDRKSTRLNSSHSQISYAVFCLKKKKKRHCTTKCNV